MKKLMLFVICILSLDYAIGMEKKEKSTSELPDFWQDPHNFKGIVSINPKVGFLTTRHSGLIQNEDNSPRDLVIVDEDKYVNSKPSGLTAQNMTNQEKIEYAMILNSLSLLEKLNKGEGFSYVEMARGEDFNNDQK